MSLHSSPTQAVASHESQGASMHTRNVSQESEDPLQWSKAKYTQNTTMPDLIKAFATTSISAAASAEAKDKGTEDTSQWCEWEWHEEYQCEYRMRQKDGKWEYEYRKPLSLGTGRICPHKEVSKVIEVDAKSKPSEPSKSQPSKSLKGTDWNEWEWSEEHKCEYRSRQKEEDGEWEYDYRQKGE
jgi:hypothetical protein